MNYKKERLQFRYRRIRIMIFYNYSIRFSNL